MDQLWRAVESCSVFCPAVFSAVVGESLTVNQKTYRIIKQLGEGGYAFVYLAKELPSPDRPITEAVAIKKIIAASGEKLREAQREVDVLRRLSHPNLLPLLDHAINRGSAGSSPIVNVLLVFPAFEDGTLVDELARLAAAGDRLSSQQVLDVFAQVCEGVAHMHTRGLAHFDIKPHNVLVRRPQHRLKQQQQGLLAPSVLPPMAGHIAEPADYEADIEAGAGLVCRGSYEAVLTDFGSARPTPITINSRASALALQEEAEAHCTATFRAPELFDVSSSCVLDGRVDVWALGCTLFALMYGGASPFQAALDHGASLALAVMNCRIPWPKPPAAAYPEPLHSLVTFCLQVDPSQRPSVPQVLERVQQVAQLLSHQ